LFLLILRRIPTSRESDVPASRNSGDELVAES
jgi:hypothetical protein